MTELTFDTLPGSSGGAFLFQTTEPHETCIPEDSTHDGVSQDSGTVGEIKDIIALCTRHATGHDSDGMTRHALAEMTAQTFALESVLCRLGTEELAVERHIASVIRAESYTRSADAALQFQQRRRGMGFANAPLERRAIAQIGTRGTQENARHAIIDLLLIQDHAGRQALFSAARDIEQEIAHATDMMEVVKTGCPQSAMESGVRDCKRLTLFLFAKTTGCIGSDLQDEPEIISAMATVICAAYALESIALRTHKMRLLGHDTLESALLAAQVAARDYADAAVQAASYALDSLPCEVGTDWRTGSYSGLTDLLARLSRPVVRPVPPRRALATHVLAQNGYPM